MAHLIDSEEHFTSGCEALSSVRERLTAAAEMAKEGAVECGNHYVAEPVKDLAELLRDYAKSRPEVVAVWCFGIGMFIGWKIRP